jgi:hypothetical protein
MTLNFQETGFQENVISVVKGLLLLQGKTLFFVQIVEKLDVEKKI